MPSRPQNIRASAARGQVDGTMDVILPHFMSITDMRKAQHNMQFLRSMGEHILAVQKLAREFVEQRGRMRPGDRVYISGKKHPHHGESGELISFGRYRLECLNLTGWLLRLDDGSHECYAKEADLKPEGRAKR